MDKRTFIKGAIVATAPGSVAAQGRERMFGVPGSVLPLEPAKANRIKLSLSRLDLPPQAWESMTAYFAAAEELATSADRRREFSSDPSTYLLQRGLAPSIADINSRDLSLLRVSDDTISQQAAAKGDYLTFLHRLQELQVTAPIGASQLAQNLTKLLREDVNAYNSVSLAFTSERADSIDEDIPDFVQASVAEAELLLAQSDDSDGDGMVSEAYLHTSISVYTNALAVTNVAAVTQAAVTVAAYLLVAAAVAAVVVVMASGGSAYGSNRLARLDRRLVDSAAKATSAARLLGNKDFEVRVMKDLLRAEITAIYEAAEAVGIVRLKARYKEMAIEAALHHAHKGLGLNPSSFANYKQRIKPVSPRRLA